MINLHGEFKYCVVLLTLNEVQELVLRWCNILCAKYQYWNVNIFFINKYGSETLILT